MCEAHSKGRKIYRLRKQKIKKNLLCFPPSARDNLSILTP